MFLRGGGADVRRAPPTLVTQRHRVADGSWGLCPRKGNLHRVERKKERVDNAPQDEEGERVAGALPGYGITVYLGNHK